MLDGGSIAFFTSGSSYRDPRVGVPPPTSLFRPISIVSGDVAQTRNSQAAFCSLIGEAPFIPTPVPPHMFAFLAGPLGRGEYPILPTIVDSAGSWSTAANSCQFGTIATCSVLKASSVAFQSHETLPGCAMDSNFL